MTSVSIIIPVYNSEKTITDLLKGIKETSLTDFEVIIVDDMSTDSTVDLCKENGFNNIITLKKKSGPSTARNIGASKAEGDILIFIDSDVILSREIDVLKRIKEIFSKNPGLDSVASISSVKPVVENAVAYNNSVYQKYFIEKLLNGNTEICGKLMYFSTRLGGIKKDSFIRAGGFYESLKTVMNEDGEFWTRCYHMGYSTYVSGDLVHYHLYPTKFDRFIRSYFLTAYVQYYISRKMDTSEDTSISNNEKYRRIFAFFLLLSPLMLIIIDLVKYAVLLSVMSCVLIISFGNMNKIIWKCVPARYLITWYIVYILITPFIILGYLWGMITYAAGRRLFAGRPSDNEFFNAQ